MLRLGKYFDKNFEKLTDLNKYTKIEQFLSILPEVIQNDDDVLNNGLNFRLLFK